MRRLAITLLASSALGLVFGQAASAADIPLKARPAPVPVVVPWSWSGFYIGAHLGAGWARQLNWTDAKPFSDDSDFTVPCNGSCHDVFFTAPASRGSHNAIGVLGGLQAGFNVQYGAVVWGIEAQYSWADLKGDHGDAFTAAFARPTNFSQDAFTTFNGADRFATKIKGIATIAGLFGIASWPNDRTLWFVKAGAAYMRADYAFTQNVTKLSCNVDDPGCEGENFNGVLTGSSSRWGYMVGTGLAFGLTDNVFAKIEYDFLGFGNKDVTLTGTVCETSLTDEPECKSRTKNFNINQSIHVLKVGLSYKFDWGKTPVAVRAAY
jgi:outer membrane immunogenic protein